MSTYRQAGFKISAFEDGFRVKCQECFVPSLGTQRRPFTLVSTIREVREWIEKHEHTEYSTLESARRESYRLYHAQPRVAALDMAWAEGQRQIKHEQVNRLTQLSTEFSQENRRCFLCGDDDDRGHVISQPGSDGRDTLLLRACESHELTDADWIRYAWVFSGVPYPTPESEDE